MERTFFNFTEKLKKPLHILMAFAVIICTAFTVPVFADNSSLNGYSIQPYYAYFSSHPSRVDLNNFGVPYWHNADNTDTYYIGINVNTNFYLFAVGNYAYICIEPSGGTAYWYYTSTSGSSAPSYSINSYSSDYSLYYKKDNTSFSYNDGFIVPSYNSVVEGLAAVRDYIDNSSRSIQTVPYYSSGSSSFGYQFASDVNSTSYYVNEQNNNFSCCAVLNGSLICASLYSSANINAGYTNNNGFIASPLTLNSVSVSDGTLYYGSINFNDINYSSDLKIYTDSNTCYSDLYNYLLTNGGSPVPDNPVWVNKPLTIPQGYAAVIDTSNMTSGNGSFRLRANTGNLGNSNLWRDVFGNDNIQSGQAIYNTNTAITSYDFDDYPQLTWSPYEYSLVRATAYEYIGEATKSNTYTYIFNPIQSNATSIKTGQNTNSYITLYMNEQFDGTVKLYPLTSMAALGQGQTIEVGNDESDNSGSGDISNGTWTNSDGNVYTPPQGGGNGTGSSQNALESIAGTVEHLGEVLNQFVGGLSTILTAPVEAIQTLINNGSAFVSQLSGLYSWLPAQVYSTLTSAIVLCITVGVLKVLL